MNFNEFLKFLSDKFVWVSTILEKMNSTSLIGIPRDMIKPFNPMGVTNIVKVAHGSTEFRTLEIFQENSLIYFNIRVESLDVNIRIYY